MPWDRYLASMAQNVEYGDQITLQAPAEILNIEILVVSSLGPDATADDCWKMYHSNGTDSTWPLCWERRGTLRVCWRRLAVRRTKYRRHRSQTLRKPSRRRARATEKPKAQKLTSVNCKTTNARVQWTVKYKFVLFQIAHWLEKIYAKRTQFTWYSVNGNPSNRYDYWYDYQNGSVFLWTVLAKPYLSCV